MTSPLVTRLVDTIDRCVDREERALKVAELACYWARVGEFAEAERLRLELRTTYGAGVSAQISIMIMCLEALLLYYKGLSPDSRDRMLRANLLSKSFKITRLYALTSAWMAHIDFNQNRIEDMVSDLVECLGCLQSGDDATLCRVSLVLGDAFLFVDDQLTARIWYDRAHRAAVRMGDQAAIGAITYNKAALHVSMARFRSLTESINSQELSMLSSEVQTAINYQAIARLKSLDHLLGTASVGVLILNDKFAAAEPEIERLLADPDIDPMSSQRHLLFADLSWIRAQTSRNEGLVEWIDAVPGISRVLANTDDRAIILHTASRVAHLLMLEERRSTLAMLASAEMEMHWSSIVTLRDRISRFQSVEILE